MRVADKTGVHFRVEGLGFRAISGGAYPVQRKALRVVQQQLLQARGVGNSPHSAPLHSQ